MAKYTNTIDWQRLFTNTKANHLQKHLPETKHHWTTFTDGNPYSNHFTVIRRTKEEEWNIPYVSITIAGLWILSNYYFK